MKLKTRIFVEIIFFIAIFIALLGDVFLISGYEVVVTFFVYILLYIHGLINRFFIFPILIIKKKYGKYSILTLITLLFFGWLVQLVQQKYAIYDNLEQAKYNTLYNGLSMCFLSLFVMSSLEFVIQYFQRKKEKAEYKTIINQLENNNLKAQLNPHFLFNSLNNAYGLSLSNPAQTPDYIMKLSQLMRYQLESTKQEFLTLEEDIEFIQNYIAIEKERIGNRCKITFENTIKPELLIQYKIAPMLFHTFLENAIKHGASTIEASYIDINFSNIDNEISFIVKNSINKIKNIGTEIGLQNAKQRLKIVYPNLHKLRIDITDDAYIVKLKLTLSKNV